MEVSFIPTTRRPFSMRVDFFETIQDIKQNIQKYHNIPSSHKQTLIFNNQTLPDDLIICRTDITYNTDIQLIISGDYQEPIPPLPLPPPTASTSTTSSEFEGILLENVDPFGSLLQEMLSFDEATMLPEKPLTVSVNQESTPATATPSTTPGSSMENIDPLESWLLEVEQESKPQLKPEKASTIKVNQEATQPPPARATRVTTFSELGIIQENTPENTLENTDRYNAWASLLSEMDLVDNSNYDQGNIPLNILPSPSKKITLLLKIPRIAINRMPVEVEIKDSIRKLKEKIINDVAKQVPLEKLIVRSNGVELHDHNTLHEYGLFDQSEIEVSVKRSPPATSSSKPTASKNTKSKNINNNNVSMKPKDPKIPKAQKKLKILVVTMYKTKTIPMEVNAWDRVEELRKLLDKVNEREPLNLSEEGFFFIHRQAVMHEDKSFQWHNVRQGDEIDIFNGYVTDGPA